MTLNIKKFDMKTMKPHRIILVVGKRGTGKSTLIKDIMYHIKENIDIPMAVTPTEESIDMFESHMPKSFIYSEYCDHTFRKMIDFQRKSGRSGGNNKGEKMQHLLLVLDDMMYDKKVLKSIEMRDIFMNGRHLKITFINAMQYVMDMGPDLRSQVDYVFALRENIISNLTKLWKYFFGMFTNYEDFAKTYKALTTNNGCIVIDNTVKTNELSECIFWYKASVNNPPYKIGRRSFWKLSGEHYRTPDELECLAHTPDEEENNNVRISCIKKQDDDDDNITGRDDMNNKKVLLNE